MKIEVWSDYVCPFCYIGKRRLEAGLQHFENREEVEVIYRSFELNPQALRDGNPGVHDMLMAKYGMSREQVIASTNQVTQQAKELGLDYRLAQAIQTNTFDAHRLAYFASSKGKQEELTERLLRAHFTETLHIGNHEILADLAGDAGLDREDALQILKNGECGEQVREDEQEAKRLNIRGVPFFLIDRKYTISGAQPGEVFLRAIRQAWEETHPVTEIKEAADGAICTDDGCEPGRSGS